MKNPLTTRRLFLAAALATASFAAATGAFAQQKVLTVGSAFVPVSLDPGLSGNGRAGMPAFSLRTNLSSLSK